MPSVVSSVRITEDAAGRLSRLTGKLDLSKARVIEEALRRLEEEVFWAEVHAAYAKPESKELREERKRWDTTVGDGLTRERW
ncbi:MAG: hypothetical protein MUC42_17790 [Bryobacter sp.]|jgi:predicted transcriptional regulator|nr:hypothetical protein [Bryobacter sp.]